MTALGKHILVVDDERNIRLMLQTTLESEGYTTEEAANGREAMAAIQRRLPDLVVLDLRMGEMDGMTVLQQISAMPPPQRPKVVVLTAHGSIGLAVRAMRSGASEFLEKPVTPTELRTTAALVLGEPAQPTAEPGPGVNRALGQVRRHLWRGDVGHAEALLMRAADLAEEHPQYFNLLGVVYEAGGRTHLAKKCYGMAVRANAKYEPAQRNMRRLYELETFGATDQEVALGDEAELLETFGRIPEGHAAGRLGEMLDKRAGT